MAKDQRVKDNNDYRMKTYHRFPTMADLAHQVKRLMLPPTFLRDVGLTLKQYLENLDHFGRSLVADEPNDKER